jgi:hypothetical protein
MKQDPRHFLAPEGPDDERTAISEMSDLETTAFVDRDDLQDSEVTAIAESDISEMTREVDLRKL